MGVLEMVNALLGRTAPQSNGANLGPGQDFQPAPPLSDFPTSDDAAYARKYGYGYGSGHEPYLNNEVARVRGSNSFELKQVPSKDFMSYAAIPKFKPESAEGLTLSEASRDDDLVSRNLDLTKPENKNTSEKMKDTYLRAALAANRIPLAALGFEPRKMVADVAITNPALYGAYTSGAGRDSIYFNTDRERGINTTPVHEAIHRGVRMLNKVSPEAHDLIRKLPTDDEYVVRWLMDSQAGGGEAKSYGMENAQIKKAKEIYGSGKYDKELNRLNELAANEIARRKPGGPN